MTQAKECVKERRVDAQIVVGLLVDRVANPLRVRAYSGNQAEKHTIAPRANAFMAEHDLSDFVALAGGILRLHSPPLAISRFGG